MNKYINILLKFYEYIFFPKISIIMFFVFMPYVISIYLNLYFNALIYLIFIIIYFYVEKLIIKFINNEKIKRKNG